MPDEDNFPHIRLTDRDYLIFETMAAFDGLMSANQIAQLLFPGLHITRMYSRMKALAQNRYVNQPTGEEARGYGAWMYWLAPRGYEVLAEREGREITKAEISHGKHRFSPRIVPHMLQVNDVHILAMQAPEHAGLVFDRWIGELQFRRWPPEQVSYTRMDGTHEKRRVFPDGFFQVKRILSEGKRERFAFLVEVDRGTQKNERLANEKYRAGTTFFKSKIYREHIGLNFGRWLVITNKGDGRMNHMREWCRNSGAAPSFYFTTFDRLLYGSRHIFTDSIWFLADKDEPVAIVPPLA
jgi:hypothetical protein